MLEIINLTCTRGDRTLFTHLAFTVSPGSLLHIRGDNGSGKTTLLRTLCGLFLQDTGEVRWGGKNIRKLQETYRKELLYLGHHNAIKDDLTGLENLHISAQLSGEPASEKNCWQALEKIGLRGYEDLPTKVLSQGQKRRVALSRLFLSKAKLWILDEPFTALDVAAVDLLQSIISKHIENDGIVLLTTHQEVALTSGHSQQLHLGA
ncbi:MAG TPA: cytochrome c biogenesis heme-transporting ATPase CcmA [Chromatiales bacterium]|nr:cytochrome c biogenesis heme-transporting ATPase CcmA [Thiotrichales bacterium]HIP66982.1 cytochrome c biogenesis heme-transporting ATPase CcmA [Chromatiales bacterium]